MGGISQRERGLELHRGHEQDGFSMEEGRNVLLPPKPTPEHCLQEPYSLPGDMHEMMDL